MPDGMGPTEDAPWRSVIAGQGPPHVADQAATR
jgi:hypothetical protein